MSDPSPNEGKGRVPPHDVNAERAVLGGLLLENGAWHVVSELQPRDFYLNRHDVIFRAMRLVEAAGQPIDTVTLRDQLATSSKLEQAGGDEYLLSLTDTIPTIANIEAHVRIVQEKAAFREIITAAYNIAAEGYGAVDDVGDFFDRASSQIGRVIDRRIRRVAEVTPMSEALSRQYEILTRRAERGETSIGYRSGFTDLDDALGGFAPGDLIIVGARPGMGKTAFANECKLGVARLSGKPVLSFELEMTEEQLVHRVWAARAEINMRFIRAAQIQGHEFRRIAQVTEELSKSGIHFVFQRGLCISDMVRITHRFRREFGEIGLIVVDYLQRMRSTLRGENRDGQMGEVVQEMKTLAGDVHCPVMGISSLNREVEKRPNRRPQLSDLRESGAIEFEADTILFLYRDEVYNPHTQKRGIAEVNVAKQRSGEAPVMVELGFTKEFTRFENLKYAQAQATQEGMSYGR